MILNSSMVAVITGTSGWEAILAEKPVINFAEHIFNEIALSKRVNEFDKLSLDIYNELIRVSKISSYEREKRIKCLLQSILSNSFRVTFPLQCLFEKGNNYEYEVSGKELFKGLLKYIEKNKLNNILI